MGFLADRAGLSPSFATPALVSERSSERASGSGSASGPRSAHGVQGGTLITEEAAVLPPDGRALPVTLLVEEGDPIACGAPVACLRDAPDICLAAPLSGRVARVTLAPGRKLTEVVIFRESDGTVARHDTAGAQDAAGLRGVLQRAGAWPLIRRRPFGGMPSPSEAPAGIMVMALDTRPFAPDPCVAVDGAADAFAQGLVALEQLTDGPVMVCLTQDAARLVAGAGRPAGKRAETVLGPGAGPAAERLPRAGDGRSVAAHAEQDEGMLGRPGGGAENHLSGRLRQRLGNGPSDGQDGGPREGRGEGRGGGSREKHGGGLPAGLRAAMEAGQGRIRAVACGARHPQGSAGIRMHALMPAGLDAPVWDIHAEDVAAIGTLLQTGVLPMARLVHVAGAALREGRMLRTHPGADLRQLTHRIVAPGPHVVLSGSPLDGHRARWLGPRDRQVSVLPRPDAPRRAHWLVAALTRSARPRPAIPTAALAQAFGGVVPALPFLRALGAGDDETAMTLGILSLLEEDVALAEYVLGGSGEVMAQLRAMLDRIRTEYAA